MQTLQRETNYLHTTIIILFTETHSTVNVLRFTELIIVKSENMRYI